ncbi:MAG: toprim domain-containing protein (plasmid) [Candidatus Cardinium sp.]|uniref:toprim domain-containing protein n=1 Tax=Cardinium endosymbiont of Dermatophagoides farinae TaxID=2597823 RepID=UPI001CB8A5BD|nr:toprim domain-containing protein [Cardinium endosymbiont of Dermatophagoides farinae]UWW97654.1 MAG: toprim domain-containing protein [Candidatus Cardinium sp.]
MRLEGPILNVRIILFGNKIQSMLTKEQVLEKAGGEENLIRHLVPTFNPNLRKKNHKSIFSVKDSRPSMSIYKDKGIWKFKSFNTGHQGDVFRMWADYYGLDCKAQFKELLQLINQEMLLGLENDSIQDLSSFKPIISKDSTDIGENRGSLPSQILHIEYMPYGNSDISRLHLEYWTQYNISKPVLERFHVKQVGFLSYTSNSNRFLSFKYREKNQIASAYDISGRIKVYVPEISSSFSSDLFFKGQRKSFSYKNQTKDDVFGLSQLDEGTLDYVLLTAGEKDCMSAYAHGFRNVISLQSEHQILSASLLEELRKRTSVILSCYDNDVAGINASKRLETSFCIVSIPLPVDIKDLAEYFRSYSSDDFQLLLDVAIKKAMLLPLQKSFGTKSTRVSNSIRSKVEHYLSGKFDFRLNVVTQQCEILVKSKCDIWEKVNVSELRGHLDRHGISCSLDVIKCILRSFFVKQFHPIQCYFLSFEGSEISGNIDYILELSSYVKLKNRDTSHAKYWYTHLKKWMIRAVRAVFERDGINKHALILCSPKENIGKSYFCEFLCPLSLISY